MRVALVLLLACGLYGEVTESEWRLRQARQHLDRGMHGNERFVAEYPSLRELYEAQQERLAADTASRK